MALWAGIIIMGLLVVLFATGNLKVLTGGTTGVTVGTNACGPNASPTSTNFIKTAPAPYSSDTLSGTTVNYFYLSGNQLVPIPTDNPGTGSFPTTSSGTYNLQNNWVMEAYDTNGYQVWTTISANQLVAPYGTGTPATLGSSGTNVLQITCGPSSSNSNAYNWIVAPTIINAPTSGTSATTNVDALMTQSTGTAFAATSALPTVPTLWNAFLQVKQAYKGGMFNYQVYGTSINPVTNFATGTNSYNSPVNVAGYMLFMTNQTGFSVTLDPTAASLIPGATITAINSVSLATGTRAWLIGPLNGGTPAPGSAASTPYNYINVPIDVYQTIGATGHHVGIVAQFVDNQQAAYIISNLVTPAQNGAGWHAASTFGIVTGVTGIQTAALQGLPAPTIEQYFNAVEGY
jgi:hypothetical protein